MKAPPSVIPTPHGLAGGFFWGLTLKHATGGAALPPNFCVLTAHVIAVPFTSTAVPRPTSCSWPLRSLADADGADPPPRVVTTCSDPFFCTRPSAATPFTASPTA